MKIKDAIDWIDIARMGYICDPNECGLEKGGDPCKMFHCDEFHDALVMAIEALEKQIPKKPIHTFIDGFTLSVPYYCPMCGEQISKYDAYARCVLKEHHCKCGQAIDWGDTDE